MPWAFFAAILFACLLAYGPAMSGEFLWDDDGHVTQPELRSLAGLGRIWFEPGATQQYYPMLHSFFWLEQRLWGDAVLGYHLSSVFLHAGSACLLFLILARLAVPGAWLAAAIFALHPVHAESVAWISEQKNTLSGLFYLGSALIYLRFDETRNWRWYAAAFGLFVAAVLSKSVTATLPAALLVVLWWKRGRLDWRRDVAPLVPWLVLGVAAGLFTAAVERTQIGASGAGFELTWTERLLLAARAPWFYLSKLLWPAGLVFVYPKWDLTAGIGYVAVVALVGVFLAAWKFRQRHRGPLAAGLFFVGTLFPVLGFFSIYPFLYSYVADHWQYLASIGVIALVAAVLVQSLSRSAEFGPWPSRLVGGLLLLVLLFLTARESRGYRNPEDFYTRIIGRNPSAWLAHNNLGAHYVMRGEAERALGHFQEALRLKPDYAQARGNLGSALVNLGRFDEALPLLEAALKTGDRRHMPNFVETQANLGVALARAGKYPEAIPLLEIALRAKPNLPEAWNALGLSLVGVERVPEGQQAYETALRLNPDLLVAHFNLGDLLARAQRVEEAITHYETGLRLAPDSAAAHRDYAIMLLFVGRPAAAVRPAEMALRLEPDEPALYRLLGDALLQAGRGADALTVFQELQRLAPTFPGVHADLAGALIAVGRFSEAFAACEEALRRDPSDPAALKYLEVLRNTQRGR